MSSDMLPDLACANLADELVADAEALCETHIGVRRGTDSADRIRGELRLSMALAAHQNPVALAALGEHVGHVVNLRTKEQVLWIDAAGCVAPMEHLDPGGNGRKVNLPAGAVCISLSPVELEVPIAASVVAADPKPAAIRLLDLGPETCDRFLIHGNPSSCEPDPERAQALRGPLHLAQEW